MNKQEYINMLDDFINTKLGATILKGEKFNEDISGDVSIEEGFKMLDLEEQIVDLVIDIFKENQKALEESSRF